MIVSHLHPSTAEGMELLSETLAPALQDASSFPVGRKDAEGRGEEDDDDREDFFWSVDVHCGGGDEGADDGGHEGSEGENDANDGDGGACEDEEDRGDSACSLVGPSAYMARKVCWHFCFRSIFYVWDACAPLFALVQTTALPFGTTPAPDVKLCYFGDRSKHSVWWSPPRGIYYQARGCSSLFLARARIERR